MRRHNGRHHIPHRHGGRMTCVARLDPNVAKTWHRGKSRLRREGVALFATLCWQAVGMPIRRCRRVEIGILALYIEFTTRNLM